MKIVLSKNTVKELNAKNAALNAACGLPAETTQKVLTFSSKFISIYENKYNYIIIINDNVMLDAFDVMIQHIPAIMQATKTVWMLVKNFNIAMDSKMRKYAESYINALFKAAEKEEARKNK